jgi:hypothetical protein
MDIMLYEFKQCLNAYLATCTDPGAATLAEIIDFNNHDAERCLKYGQTIALDAEHKTGTIKWTDVTPMAELVVEDPKALSMPETTDPIQVYNTNPNPGGNFYQTAGGKPNLAAPPTIDVTGFDMVVSGIDEIADFSAYAFHDHHLQPTVIAFYDLGDRSDLGIGKVLFVVCVAHSRGGGGEIALPVEIAVFEIGLLGDFGFAEKVGALHRHRSLIAQFALYEEYDLNSGFAALRIGADVFKLAGILERIDIPRQSDGIVHGTGFRLTPAQHRPDITSKAIERLYFDINNIGGEHGRAEHTYCS